MGKKRINSRAKGAAFERSVVAKAIEYGFKGAHRTAPMQAGHPRKYPDVMGVGILALECKAYAANVPANMVREALDEQDEMPGYVRAVVWKTNRSPLRITMNFEDALKLLSDPPPVYVTTFSVGEPVTVEDALTTMALGPKKGDA